MRKLRYSYLAAPAMCGALAFLLAGCGGGKTDPKAEAPPAPKVEADLDANNFKADHPEQFPLVAAVEYKVAPALNVTGVVQPDIARAVPVISLAAGRVVEVKARLGDEVKKGQLLMRVQSNDVSGAYQAYRKAVNDETLARIQLERQKLLYEKGAVAKSAVEQAEDVAKNAQADLDASSEQLKTLGVDKNNPNAIVNVYAPISGVISDQQVTNAAGVQGLGAPNPFTISDLSYVWIICDVYENDLDAVKVGDTADVQLNAFPGKTFKARIDNILPTLDPNLRTAKVRLEVANPGFMRVGMFATATFYGKRAETRAAVPATAILHLHDREWVYAPLGAGHFKRMEVVTGKMLPNNMQEVTSGLKAGDQVVSNALALQNTVEQSMIRRVVDFALNNRMLVLAFALIMFAGGGVAFRNLPIEAYPDVADNYVEVITQWPGISAEQIEQQVTIPLEVALNGIPQTVHLRSFSLFGLSDIKLIFDDGSDDDWNRERVLERLSQVTLPSGVVPQMGTDWSPVGQIYFFTLHSTNPAYDAMELKSLEDWVVEKNFKSIPDIVDVASFGGPTREYQVRVDPNKLIAYGLSLSQVEQQLTNNNTNAGGSFIQEGLQQINVRSVGLVDRSQDIADTVVVAKNGTPLRVKDIAVVSQGPKIRLGQFARAIHREDGRIIDNNDVVSGIVLLRKGATAETALEGIHKKVEELNQHILPPGVTIVPFLDRSQLVHYTSHTVLHNLTEGMILVSVILLLFLGNVRGALIVAMTIPFALLFASICLKAMHIPANLLSLGALDFGVIVEGAVVLLENIVRQLSHSDGTKTSNEIIGFASHEVQRPVFFAIIITITSFLPIFTLQRVEGRLFHPMAWTVAFALLGALVFSIVVAPVLSSFAFAKGTKEWSNPAMTWVIARYQVALRWAIRRRMVTVGLCLIMVLIGGYLAFSGAIGSEFLPHLDEGALWVRGTLAPSTGPDEGIRVANQARVVLCSFPEVPQCTSQVGRPDDGTDNTGFFNTEYFVDLKPKEQWRPVFHEDKEELIAAMNRELSKIPGVDWGFSQPIEDNMEEAVSGVKGALATKVYGDSLKVLEEKSDQIAKVMSQIKGVEDLGVFRVLGQPNLNVTVDREAAARYQINVTDVQDAVQTAVGGNALTQVLKDEARYDLTLRYLPKYRDTREAIENIRLLAPNGERVSLAQLCKIKVTDGASEVYREGNRRYVAIKYSVRGRDLGSTVEEAIKKVNDEVKLPPGYTIDWEGEYASQKRANARLAIVLPITILIIYIILYTMFKSMKWATLIMANIAIAPIGGLLALWFTGTNFSVSSGVGFLALFGVSVQTGVIMLEYINQLRARRFTVEDAAVEGAVLRLRPIMMTMLVATLGLLPAALSHAIGSDSQRPFAIVIVGGLIAALVMSVFLLPTLYVWVAGERDVLPRAEEGFDVGEHVD